MKKKRNRKEIHRHHHWHNCDMTIKTLFWGFIILLIIANALNVIDNELTKKEDMYNSCLSACTEKPYYWNQNPKVVDVGDRVECIRVCNSFHYSLKS